MGTVDFRRNLLGVRNDGSPSLFVLGEVTSGPSPVSELSEQAEQMGLKGVLLFYIVSAVWKSLL